MLVGVAVVCLAAGCLTCGGRTELPSGFVHVTERVPDAILEIRYHSTYNFVGKRIDGYDAPEAILTEKAAAALRKASDALKERGYRLKIYDAYRPQRAVDHFMRWAADRNDVKMRAVFYPELDKSVLFEQGYIAAKSGHSRGSTVDLTLVEAATGREVDMGGAFDYFGRRSHFDFTEGLTSAQIGNRRILREAMVAAGSSRLRRSGGISRSRTSPILTVTSTSPCGL